MKPWEEVAGQPFNSFETSLFSQWQPARLRAAAAALAWALLGLAGGASRLPGVTRLPPEDVFLPRDESSSGGAAVCASHAEDL